MRNLKKVGNFMTVNQWLLLNDTLETYKECGKIHCCDLNSCIEAVTAIAKRIRNGDIVIEQCVNLCEKKAGNVFGDMYCGCFKEKDLEELWDNVNLLNSLLP